MQDILYLVHRIPYPPNKGDKIRACHVLGYLQRRFRVHLGCFIDDADDLQYADQLAAGCAGSCFIRLQPLRARCASLSGLWRGEALSLPYYRDDRLQRWVSATLDQYRIRSALAFSGPMAQYLPARTRHGPLQRIMDLVDVDSAKWQAYAATLAWPLSQLYRREGRLLLDFERDVARKFDRLLLVSQAETALFKQLAPESQHKIDFFNNGVDADYFSPRQDRPSPYAGPGPILVMSGAMDYWPNVDAAQWFAQAVLPSLLAQFPGVQFHIVGARPARPVLALAALPGVHVSGTVPDIRPYLQHATLAVAPLRIARGVQNKVLEAMAMQKVVIATPDALQGVSATPGHELLCAANAAEFIFHISQQLAQPGTGEMAAAARRRILQDYQWERNLQRLGDALGLDGTSSDSLIRRGAMQ